MVRFSGLGAPRNLYKISTTLPQAETQTDTPLSPPAVSQGKAEHLGLESHLTISHFTTDINTHFQA